MTDYLSLTDLFLVGLAFDICGAILLGKGLLLSPRLLSKLNTWWGVSDGQHQERCENRVAGEFGMSYLIVGFFLQAVGYLLDIAGVESATGTCRLFAVLLMGLVAGGVAWLAWDLGRGPRLRTLQASVQREREAAKKEIEEGEGENEG